MKPRVRIGCTGYATCLGAIAFGGGQATWQAVAEAAGITRATAGEWCHTMNDLRVIHVTGWVKTGMDNRSRTATYGLGDGPDAPYPGTATRPRKNRRADSVEMLTFAHAIKALQEDSHHGLSLSKVTGMYPRAARRLIKALHKKKLAYIAEYHDRGAAGLGHPMFAFGLSMRDVKKPAPIPQAQLNREWNEVKRRLRADTKLMRGLVTGANGDRRTSPYRRQPEAAGATP